MNNVNQTQTDLAMERFCEGLLPRLLTQVCRDPNSPAYGCFDRNWWHYKIRDFPSIILQQGGYALYCAAQLPAFTSQADGLRGLAAASCRFWNQRAVKYGAFEEYYPWERGYPPVAFSALTVAKLAASGVVDVKVIMPGLKRAARDLQNRFEARAANQQVTGTAALCWIRKIAPSLIDGNRFETICNRTLECQHSEGWYMEYGGPDLGYLSVTMDCLWDAYDATGDERFRASAAKALEFISPFASMPQRGAGMHNSRNTDYIVPYGIARFLEFEEYELTAKMVLGRVFEEICDPNHFLRAIDDRYYCHYIGHSLFRSIGLIGNLQAAETNVMDDYYEGSGHWLRSKTQSGCAAIVSTSKGGIFSLWFDGAECADFGWVALNGDKEWVSHWWADFWRVERSENAITVKGQLVPHRENQSTPWKHMLLRGLSFLFGRRIIGLLKEKMIFKERSVNGPFYSRTVIFQEESVKVVDVLGIENADKLERAPRSSKRHVASADSYHREDLCRCDAGISIDEKRFCSEGQTRIETVYARMKR